MKIIKIILLIIIGLLMNCFNVPQNKQGNPVGNEIQISFISEITADDLIIKSLAAIKTDNGLIMFTLQYQSGNDRFLSFFDPPAGKIVSYFDKKGIKKNKNQVSFSIKKEKLAGISELSMKFSILKNPEQDANFIFLVLDNENVKSFLEILPLKNDEKETLNPYDDVRFKKLNLVSSQLNKEMIATLWFNEKNYFYESESIANEIMETGKNPGLGIRSLHNRGITGKGVTVAIIDQNLCLNHPEFKGKIIEYYDTGCNTPANSGSMHGPAVTSLLAGNNIGTAPGVSLYYAAAPSWTGDAKYFADGLQWLIEKNKTLTLQNKIRVVSVSAAPSGEGSPFTENNILWDKAVQNAALEGILVLDCTTNYGFIGPCYYNPESPDDLSLCKPGWPDQSASIFTKNILAPTSYRTQAEEYTEGEPSYQFTGRGGLSWGIPYTAGVLALGWQIKPELTGEEIKAILFSSGYKNDDGSLIINPVNFIKRIKSLE